MEVFEILLGTILCVFIAPFVFILFILRYSVNLLALIFKPKLIPSTPGEQQLLTYPERLGVFQIFVLKFNSKICLKKLKEKFTQVILHDKNSKFYSKIVFFCGYYFTQKVEEIDLDFHVREVENPEGEGIEQLMLRFGNKNEMLGREGVPPWELLVCNDIPDRTNIVLIKVHHCLMDGISLLSVVDKLTGNKSPNMTKDLKWDTSFINMLKITLKSPCVLLRDSIWVLRDSIKGNFNERVCQKINISGGEEDFTPLLSTFTLDFSKLRAIRNKTGTKISPLISCVRAAAMEKMLKDLGRISHDHSSIYRDWIMQPTTNHPAQGSLNILGNQTNFGSCGLDLKENDLMNRLKTFGKSWSTWESKDMHLINFYLVTNLLYILPIVPTNISDGIFRIFPHFSVLSTLVASPNPYFLFDQEVQAINFYCSYPPSFEMHSSMMNSISRGDEMGVTFVISKMICKNQEEIDLYVKQYLVESLDQHYKLCMEKYKN